MDKISIGVDVGSRTCKLVVLRNDKIAFATAVKSNFFREIIIVGTASRDQYFNMRNRVERLCDLHCGMFNNGIQQVFDTFIAFGLLR
jgi:activator of 2-hydroxyglutaryl-CoA dehydratase